MFSTQDISMLHANQEFLRAYSSYGLHQKTKTSSITFTIQKEVFVGTTLENIFQGFIKGEKFGNYCYILIKTMRLLCNPILPVDNNLSLAYHSLLESS